VNGGMRLGLGLGLGGGFADMVGDVAAWEFGGRGMWLFWGLVVVMGQWMVCVLM
jgi:hypothetical protein